MSVTTCCQQADIWMRSLALYLSVLTGPQRPVNRSVTSFCDRAAAMNNTTLMDQLQILQNKAAKTILDAPYLSSSTEALSNLHWHPLTHRRYSHRMLTIFKLKINLIDYDFDLPKANHLHNTRQKITFISANLVPIGESRNFYTKLVRSIMI